MTKSRRAVFALILSLVLSAFTLVLMLFALQPAAKGGSLAPTPSEASSDQQMTILVDDSVPQPEHSPPSETSSNQQMTVTILVDDYAPQPMQGHDFWSHNRLGGERWPTGDSPPPNKTKVFWGKGVVTATYTGGTGEIGVWTSLNHPLTDRTPINFSAIFPSQIMTNYQGRITGLQIHVVTGTGTFYAQLKCEKASSCAPRLPDDVVWRSPDVTLTGTQRVLSFDLHQTPALTEITNLNWVITGSVGSSVVISRVELTATVPQLDTPQRAFLWSYAQLLSSWDPKSGLIRDQAHFTANQFDNLSANGLLAASTVMAWHLGFISKDSATEIVSKTTQALLALPRCHGLWPHFTMKVISDTQVISNAEIVTDTEWSSIDTTIAAVALIEAREALELAPTETISVEQVLKDIDWQDLILPNRRSISFGYTTATPECAQLRASGQLTRFCGCSQRMEGDWKPFGLESWIVNFGYATATSKVANFDHTPPTWNGGGFIDELAWLLMPTPYRDRWGTEWRTYSQQAVDRQLAYYRCQEAQAGGCCGDNRDCQEQDAKEGCLCCRDHPCYGWLRLFGLTPAEPPDLSIFPPTAKVHYLDFGICGKDSCIDGTDPVTIPGVTSTVVVSLDHAVIVPQYAGIIASLRPTRAISMWNWLETEELFTPLNNAESFMFTDEVTPTNGLTCTHIVWNARKGAWELGLQTLGWGRYLAGNDNPLYRGFRANDMLRRGYDAMRYPAPARIALKTHHDRYVTAMGAESDWVLSQTVELTDCGKFTSIYLNDGKIAFKTCYDRYVTAEDDTAEDEKKDWVLRAETTEIRAWEEFTPILIYSDSGKVAFKTYHDRYVTAMDAASDWVLSQTVELTDCGKFIMISLPTTPIYLPVILKNYSP